MKQLKGDSGCFSHFEQYCPKMYIWKEYIWDESIAIKPFVVELIYFSSCISYENIFSKKYNYCSPVVREIKPNWQQWEMDWDFWYNRYLSKIIPSKILWYASSSPYDWLNVWIWRCIVVGQNYYYRIHVQPWVVSPSYSQRRHEESQNLSNNFKFHWSNKEDTWKKNTRPG